VLADDYPDMPRRGGMAPRAIRLADQKWKGLEKGLLRNATLHSIRAIRCAASIDREEAFSRCFEPSPARLLETGDPAAPRCAGDSANCDPFSVLEDTVPPVEDALIEAVTRHCLASLNLDGWRTRHH
jgi:hypothetical protein